MQYCYLMCIGHYCYYYMHCCFKLFLLLPILLLRLFIPLLLHLLSVHCYFIYYYYYYYYLTMITHLLRILPTIDITVLYFRLYMGLFLLPLLLLALLLDYY